MTSGKNSAHDQRKPPLASIGLTLATLAGNLAALAVFFIYDLSVFQLVCMYWWEGIWIGIFTMLKLLCASLFGAPYDTTHVSVSRGSAVVFTVLTVAFFAAKYLLMMTSAAVLLIGGTAALTDTSAFDLLGSALFAVVASSMVLAMGHLVTFLFGFLVGREYRHARATTLIAEAFRYTLVLLIAVMVALAISMWFAQWQSAAAVAVLVVAIKIGFDLLAGRRIRPKSATVVH